MRHKFPKALLIDLDGTLADTMGELYQVYLSFLQDHGKVPSDEEYQTLVGPPLTVIVAMMKELHQLPGDHHLLLQEYRSRVEKALAQTPLMAGALDFLQRAFREGYGLVLVTSSPKVLAENFLQRHNLASFFSYIVTCDDVTNGKPHPEPYLLGLRLIDLPAENCLAIEDSVQGMQSAKSAGLQVIPFTSWNEIDQNIPQRFEWMPIEPGFKVTLVPASHPPLPAHLEARKEVIWEEESRDHPFLFNGQILCVKEVQPTEISAFLIDFKDVLATARDKEIAQYLNIETLGLSGIAFYGENVLVARRSPYVLHNPLCWEFPPSGSLDPHSLVENEANLFQAIEIELREECGILPSQVLKITPFAIARDLWTGITDICMRIDLSTDYPQPNPTPNPEYTEFRWLPWSEAAAHFHANKDAVPLSRILPHLFHK